MSMRLDHPEALLLLLLALPIAWLGWRSLASLDVARRRAAIALRVAVLTLLTLMLAGPQSVRKHDDLTVVAVIDESESVRWFARPPAGWSGGAAAPSRLTTRPAGAATRAAHDGDDTEPTIAQWIDAWLAAAVKGKRPDDRIGVLAFDAQPTVRSLPGPLLELNAAPQDSPRDGTDLAAALRQAMAMFPADSARRIVLFSDGCDTTTTDEASTQDDSQAFSEGTGAPAGARSGTSETWLTGDLMAAVREAAAAGVKIDVAPLDYRVAREVLVEGVYAPLEAREGQTAAVRVVLRSTRPASGRLFVKHDGRPVRVAAPGGGQRPFTTISNRDWVRRATGTGAGDAMTTTQTSGTAAGHESNRGDHDNRGAEDFLCVRLVEVPLPGVGVNRFEAIFEADDESDQVGANNRGEAFTLVHGKGRVLLVDHESEGAGQVLAGALRNRGIRLDIGVAEALPHDAAGLQRYDAILLQNVAADRVSTEQKRLLASYVSDLGGGLMMIGGPDSFGAGGWTNTPVDRVLPVNCEVPNQKVLPSGALVIVLDRSGSMAEQAQGDTRSKQEIANEAAALAIQSLYPQDLVGVVEFSGSADWAVPLRIHDDLRPVVRAVRGIKPMGGTNIAAGLDLAVRNLAPIKTDEAAVKHIILLTDGQSLDGDYDALQRRMTEGGITLSTVGVGKDVNHDLLKKLAVNGGGTYYPVSDPGLLPQIFIKEARVIRRNLIKEKPFNPRLRATGSPVTMGLSVPPPLRGLVLTAPKPDPRVYLTMLGGDDEPLMAHWQVGLGRSAAFTSDATTRWAGDWVQWTGYGDLWARLVRHISRPSQSPSFDLQATLHGNMLTLRLDTAGADSATDAGALPGAMGALRALAYRATGVVLGPNGVSQTVRLRPTGAGVYEAQVRADASGSYLATLMIDGAQGERFTAIAGANRPAGAELRRFRSNRAAMIRIAQITGGRILQTPAPGASGFPGFSGLAGVSGSSGASTPRAGTPGAGAGAGPGGLFDRTGLEPTRSMRPLWRPLLVLLMALFLADVAVRRIAWDGPAVRRWLDARFSRAGDLLRPRQVEVQVTLAALKERAARTDRQLDSTAPPTPTFILPATPSDGPAQISLSGGDPATRDAASRDTLTSDTKSGDAAQAAPDANPSTTPTFTARLLDAKRRAAPGSTPGSTPGSARAPDSDSTRPPPENPA